MGVRVLVLFGNVFKPFSPYLDPLVAVRPVEAFSDVRSFWGNRHVGLTVTETGQELRNSLSASYRLVRDSRDGC